MVKASDPLQPLASLDELVPDTFVAFLLKDGSQVVGHFLKAGPASKGKFVLDLPENRGVLFIPMTEVVQAYWAPLGYRPIVRLPS